MGSEFWKEVRHQFRLDPDLLHFGAFWISSYPAAVRHAIDFYRDAIDFNPVFYVLDNEQPFDEAVRKSVAGFIQGNEDRIVLTGSTTEGLMLSIGMLQLEPGDEIVTTSHEHYSAYSAVQALRDRTGARVRTVSLYQDGEPLIESRILSALIDEITDQTRLIVITWVHSGTGVRLPLQQIGSRVAEINTKRKPADRVLIAVDATHGFGVLQTNIKDLECDMFVTSCHKWLNGPHGTGFVQFSELALARVSPLLPSFAPGPLGRFTGRRPNCEEAWERLTPGGFHAFENRWAVRAAIDFASAIGQQRIEQRICDLASRLKWGLMSIDKLRIITPLPPPQSAGIVCIEIPGVAPEDIVKGLRARSVVASVSPYRVRHARLTPSIYNDEEDVDAVINRLSQFAKSL